MFKFRQWCAARSCAIARALSFGLCVFDGFFYVGTVEQLGKIGVLIEESRP